MTKKRNIKRKINKLKVFCFVSFIFLLICCLWYGGRAVYFYLESKESIKNEEKKLSQTIINNNENSDNFKKINNDYYFYKDATNNYVTYSNMLWRIIKVNNKNNVMLILDNSITSLAYGNSKKYNNSYITKWLNKEDNSLTKKLNDTDKYLVKNEICVDDVKDIKSVTCKKQDKDNYISLLSVVDYINTGASKSFINNGEYNYLINNNKNNKIWYMNADGKLDVSNGDDIYGVRPVITIKSNISITGGDGSSKSPYTIEAKNAYFASYVKLGEDLWRVYDIDNDILKLSLNDYLKVNGENLEYSYSNQNYYHNDTTYGSLAYYLNHRYLNSLAYKDLILDGKYNNGCYGKSTKYDYQDILKQQIDTKIYTLSIGDYIINNTLSGYFLATGTDEDSNTIYIMNKDNTLEEYAVNEEAYVIPTISINKDNLKAGNGTINDPYRTE